MGCAGWLPAGVVSGGRRAVLHAAQHGYRRLHPPDFAGSHRAVCSHLDRHVPHAEDDHHRLRQESPRAAIRYAAVMATPLKRALVTGGAGLIGSHIVDLLVREGWTVRILDNLEPKI